MATSYSSLGFIGVGAMGKLMVENLAKSTTPGTKIFINDINQAALDELCAKYPTSVVQCHTAKEVAEKSVHETQSYSFTLHTIISN